MKIATLAATAALSLAAAGPALAAPAFYGSWSCAQLVDNAVAASDWVRETYGADGVRVGAEEKAAPLKVRAIRKGVFDLGYADGGRARIAMKEPWLFIRGTMEHSYVCLRSAP
jgi:hypothetical protein